GNAWNSNYVAEDVVHTWSTKLANTQSNQAGKFYEEYTPALAHNSPAPAVASTLSAGGHPDSNVPGRHREDDENLVAFGGNNTSGSIDVAAARSSRGNRYDFETDTFVVAGTLQGSRKAAGSATGQDAEAGLLVAHPLRASDGHHGRSGGGAGRGD